MEEKEKRPNTHLRRERELKGWSQRALAELLGTNEQVVNRWESGQHKPNRHFQTQLCQLFGKSAQDLGFMGESQGTTEEGVSRTDTARESTLEQSSPFPLEQRNKLRAMLPLPSQVIPQAMIEMARELERATDLDKSRRDLLQQLISLAGVTAISPTSIASLGGLDPFLYDSAQSCSLDETAPETLAHFAALTETCRRLSEGNELKIAERILWSYLPRVESIAKLSFKDQCTATAITSQGYLLAASLAGHRNDLLARHHYSEQALLYGKLAEDRNLQIAALRQLAITFDYLERPDKVLQIYQQALPYLDETSSLLRACIYAGVSGTYTQLKQQQEALRFLGLAYEHFPANSENEPSFLRTFCQYPTLILCDGLHHLSFGQPHKAEKAFAQLDGLQPKIHGSERIRTELLNCQVEVFITLKDMERACHYLEAAIKASFAIKSERRLQESFAIFQRMRKVWPNESRVQDLDDLFMQGTINHTH